MVNNMGESGSQTEPKGKSPHAVGEIWRLLQEKDEIIKSQERKIHSLQDEVKILKSEREDLLRKIAERSIDGDDSVTSARTGEELLRQKSRSRSVGGSPLESPRGSKLVNQNSTVQNSRCQRQRSFRRSEDDVKRSRSQSLAYELSQDLQEKQVEMLERKYGGSIRSRRAAKIIQRAFRQYCMNKNFEKMRIAVGERRLSKRLSEVGRSNTVWTDRLSADSHFINNASVIQSNGDVKRHSADVPQNGSLKRISDYDPIKRGENKVKHQRSLDPNASRKEISQRNSLTNRDKLKRLVRTKEVEIDNSDIQINQNDLKKKPAVVDETNNNRNSCPEMNESSASDSPQPTPVESTIDLHSLDFETLVESKETDILTDSFHNEGLHCDPEIVNTLGYHKPSSASLFSNASTDTLDSNKSQVSTYDNFRSNNSDSGSFGSQGDIQIKIDHVSLDDTIRTPEQKEMADQTLRYYQNQEVKMRSRNSMENIAKKPPVVPVRAPEASPIWKRKNVPNGGPPPPPAVKILEPKRMSNISETSEDTSVDGHYSSSPSSENISAENLSIVNETLTYQRKLRLSVTPDHSHTIPKTADKYRKRIYRIGLNFFNKKPDKGIQFLCEHGFIDESPSVVAKFLITRKGLSKQMIGEYLGNLQNEFNMEVLHYFAEAIDLAGLQVDMALRKFQSYFRMPGEAQKIERLMEAFAQRYCYCNPDQIKSFKNPDTIFLLAFAIIMLNTDLHNRSIKQERKMKLEDFVKNLRGIDDGEDVDKDLLMGIYDRIQAQEFRHGVDHVTQVLKVEQTIVGKRPFSTLALPHRRLVCYCRLYEVHDPNKKEKIGLHQREVFLFNDFLLVTKIFSKKKTGITYSYKTSFSLSGMQVFLFETSHYHFGIRLTSSIDSKVLITFNSRNDHDRQKFVEDLKEAILESNGMEQLRIEEELHRHSTTHNTIDRHYATDDTRVLMYELMKPSDPAVNRLSAPECGGLKKIPLSNSLTDLCEAQGMKRGSSGGSLDSGVASGGSAGVNSSGDSFVTQTSQTSLLSSKGPSSSSLVSGNHIGIRGRGGKLSSSSLGQALPEGTEV